MPLPFRRLLSALCVVLTLSCAHAATVSIVANHSSLEPPARHGLAKLEDALRTQGWNTERSNTADDARGDVIVFATLVADLPPFAPRSAQSLDTPESLAVKKFSYGGTPAVLFTGSDARGLMYALLDAAERIVSPSQDLLDAIREVEESPLVKNRTLSVYTMHRATWEQRFHDEAYWQRYFDMLAANRFNRFMIVFGYENGGFLAPPYPYFFDTPGFPEVYMVDLTPEQQRHNLEALNRLIDLAHERGIAVTLGIWDHIYRGGVQEGGATWIDKTGNTPIPSSIQGVATDNINDYTFTSLQTLLEKVPGVDGLQFRVHEESGLSNEGMEGFWRKIFETATTARPDMFIELRGKNTPRAVIDTAVAMGIPLQVETKYWMEQMGLPFHPLHVNTQDQRNTRHGYANFLRYPQGYHMTWRLWNGGTTRVLLWGDPDYVRRFSASTALYDSPNWDVQEPLATKMVARRPDLPPFDLMPERYRYYDYEFERYWQFYRVWGRLGYNPDTSAEIWQHDFQQRFGAAAPYVEAGLQEASRILPRIVASVYPYSLFPTTRGWAERQALGASLEDYANNEGSDIELFENFADAASRIANSGTTAKVTPYATSQWFDAVADLVLAHVQAAENTIGDRRSLEFDSTLTDLKILTQLARFHARRSVAAVHFHLFLKTGNQAELAAAIAGEKNAIEAWRGIVTAAGDRYAFDLIFGPDFFNLANHWRDELAKLEGNLPALEARLVASADRAAPAWQPRDTGDLAPPSVEHSRVESAIVGQPQRIVVRVSDPAGVQSVRLRYRHVTQYEDYQTLEMQPTGRPDEYAATIPGDFLIREWNTMYFLECIDSLGNGTIWPDFRREEPYVIIEMVR